MFVLYIDATAKKKKMREALKNAIAPGRTRAGSNVDFAQAEPERSERQTLVDAVEIKRYSP
jgi:cob(I)alamin adenosyltransferase